MSNTLQQLYDFITALEQLKKIERFKGQFYWKEYPKRKRYESVADHSWRLSTMVMLFSGHTTRKFDLEKSLKMALIHDIPEIIAGDESPMGKDGTGKQTYAFDERKRAEKQYAEVKAAHSIFSKLPKKQADKLYKLWLEYEQQSSYEAKIVKALDKIECLLQVYEYRKEYMFKNHLEFSLAYGTKGSDVDDALKAFGQLVSLKTKEHFKEYNLRKK